MRVAFSCLSFFVLSIVFLVNLVLATFSFRHPYSTCVWTERQLRKVIKNASNKTRTRVTLCHQSIYISNITNPDNSTGIELTDRFIDLRCYLKRSKGTCYLDGRGLSRIFIGERTDLTVRNVVFTNAKPDDDFQGGAISLDYSNLSLIMCSFNYIGNGYTGFGGGAIYVYRSTLKISGGSKNRPVTFSNNMDTFVGALWAEESEVYIYGYTEFRENFGRLIGTVYLANSTFNIKNVLFYGNYGEVATSLYSVFSHSTMKNVEFVGICGAQHPETVIGFSSLQATSCTFNNLQVTGIKTWFSQVTLKNSTFSNYPRNEYGSNIYIDDDDDPLVDGTFVSCESNVVFCNGLDETSIYEAEYDNTFNFSNTNCKTKGVQGLPGQGNCPIGWGGK